MIPWSAISGIGNSTPARLTALAPLIGYLIIYNQLIADFFFLSKAGKVHDNSPVTILDLFRDNKLTFLYFGLVLFGVGAIIFSLFAPKSIRKYKTAEEYVVSVEPAKTDWLIVENLTRVGRAAVSGEYLNQSESYGATSLSFTDETFYQLDAILEHAGHNAFDDDDRTEGGVDPEGDFGFYNGLANIMTDRVLECILMRRRVDRVLWLSAIDVIVKDRARDVLYMAYTFDEWSNFPMRLASATMFLVGGILLAIPTIVTSVEVVSQFWN
jgi:hypothetical protein